MNLRLKLLTPVLILSLLKIYSKEKDVKSLTLSPQEKITELRIAFSNNIKYSTFEYPDPVIVKAEVTNESGIDILPWGDVDLFLDSVKIASGEIDGDGEVYFTFNDMLPGTYTFYAIYRGDTNFAEKSSDKFNVTVTDNVSVKPIHNTLDVNAYYNNGYLYINNLNVGTTIKLYNAAGQCYYSKRSVTEKEMIEASGIFILKVYNRGKIYSKKFVGNKH